VKESIHQELFKLEPSTLISLYELVLKDFGKSYRFHAGENGYLEAIVFAGQTYDFMPIQAEGFEYGDGKLPRPTIKVDNTESFFSLKTRFFEDFIGFEFIRTRTFVKFLDAVNFPNDVNPYGTASTSTSSNSFPPEKYIVNQKLEENTSLVSFELVSPLELEDAHIPNRKVIGSTCQWEYRSTIGCGYTQLPKTDSKGNPFQTPLVNRGDWAAGTSYSVRDYVKVPGDGNAPPDRYYVCVGAITSDTNPSSDRDNWVVDECPKNISGCRTRHGAGEETVGLPFGGFPGVSKF